MTHWKWEFQRYMDIVKIHGFAPKFAEMAERCAYVSRKGCIDFYWDGDVADKVSLNLMKQAQDSSSFTRQWTADAEKKCATWEKFTESIAKKDLKKLSNQELFDIFEKFDQVHLAAGSFAVLIRMIVHRVVGEFEKIIQQKAGTDAPNLVATLTSTPKESFNGEEEKEFFKLAFAILKKESPPNLSEVSLKKIEKHLQKYCWIPCGYFDEAPHDTGYYLHRLRRIARDQKAAHAAFEKIETLGTKLKQEQKKILKTLQLDEKNIRLINCLQECVYYKDFVRGALNKGYYLLYPYFAELGSRCGLSMLDVKFLFKDELKEALLKNKNFTDLIKKRKDFYVLTNEHGVLQTFFGAEAEKMAAEIEGRTEKEVTELKGMCANKGYAKARARIVRDPKDIQNETHDFILVASMTTPEFVVAMQKCLAIVTDEGGITCHAAIVAREMNKPCIIGTKTATKVFKHGDIIEVDADKGIVRKLVEKRKA
ncbi:MAG: PEP-utilizing enzyme [Candidatus Woesearchaeota archaeon]|nr:PEP-utilizing enzyme [Candidatus Woesearchaeota archaeon]